MEKRLDKGKGGLGLLRGVNYGKTNVWGKLMEDKGSFINVF